MERKNDKRLKNTARMLRKNMTDEERRLWYCFLRGHKVKFYRQRPIGKYIVDFYCSKAKLVVELDGSGHDTAKGVRCDNERTEHLKQFGLKVIRIPNIYVKRSFDGVCDYIDKLVKERTEALNCENDK